MFSTGCTTPSISSLSIRESLYRSFDTSQPQSSQHNDYSPYHRMGDIKVKVSTDCKYIIPITDAIFILINYYSMNLV